MGLQATYTSTVSQFLHVGYRKDTPTALGIIPQGCGSWRGLPFSLHPNSVLRDDRHRLGPGKHCLSLRGWETRMSVMETVGTLFQGLSD